MSNCAVVGINWGDEGKGRMVDLLTKDYDVVVRFQGGGNAGHTVINENGKFALHLLPSGVFRKGVVNVLGNSVALDPENLTKEIQEVTSKGVAITPDNLMISDRASGTVSWMNWRSSVWRTKNTVRPNRASLRSTRISIRKKLFWQANCSIPMN